MIERRYDLLCFLLRVRLMQLRIARRARFDRLLFQSACIGILGGLCSTLFRETELDIRWLSQGTCADLVTYAMSLPPLIRLLFPTVGGVIAGSLLWISQKTLKSTRTVDYLEAIRLWEGQIPARAALARLLSSLSSITTGASIGREGGMVQLTATTASLFGRSLGECGIRLRLMVACGAAAGISAGYNAPLTGPLFIAEVVIGSLSFETFAPLMVASVMAAVISSHWLDMKPLFDIPPFARTVEIPFSNALLVGLIGGIAAPVFLRVLGAVRSAFSYFNWPLPVRLGAGGLLVGTLSLGVPEVWGNGHAVVESILNENPMLSTVVLIFIFKLLATAASFGSGTVGGVLTPTLTLGACLGWIFSQLNEGCTQQSIAYAALGMGALLSGTTLAPIMSTLMLFEMTLDSALFFPLMVSNFVARYLAAAIRPISVYGTPPGTLAQNKPSALLVSTATSKAVTVVRSDETLRDILQRFWFSGCDRLWVVDQDGRYQGHFMKKNLLVNSNRARAGELLVAAFIEKGPILAPSMPLSEGLQHMQSSRASRLPVVDANQILISELSHFETLLTLHAN